MTAVTLIKAALQADAALTGMLPGGVYDWAETGRNGISRQATPSAYGTDGFLRPCALVKGRDLVPWGSLMDMGLQSTSARQVVEVWFYDHGDASYAAVEGARERVRSLLHLRLINGLGRPLWAGDLNGFRDPQMDNAIALRADYVTTQILCP